MLINDRQEKQETGLNLRAMRRDLLQDQDEAGESLAAFDHDDNNSNNMLDDEYADAEQLTEAADDEYAENEYGDSEEYDESSNIALQDEDMEDFDDEFAGQIDHEWYEEDKEVDYKYYELAIGDPLGSVEKSLKIDDDDWFKYDKKSNVPLAFLLFIASIVVSLVFGGRQGKSTRQRKKL